MSRAVASLEESQRFVREAVVEAMAAAGLRQKDLAAMMDIPASQFTRQMHGLEHLSVQRLILIDNATFWLVLLAKCRERFGLHESTSEVMRACRQLIVALARTTVVLTRSCRPAEPVAQQRKAS